MAHTARNYPATERTVKFIQSLIDERDLTASARFREDTASMDAQEMEQYKCRLRQRPRTMTQHEASQWITALQGLPFAHKAGKLTQDIRDIGGKVPAGRYAVTGNDGSTDFYKVDRPDKGKWKGYTFVKLGLGGPHGSEPRWERTSRSTSAAVLAKILVAGPEAAAKRYGKELGHCGICGRTLTNPESIERGIGPVCAGNSGWTF